MTLNSSSAYKAPLIKIDDPGEAHVHGAYIVNLFTGHTLDQHSTAVGHDMQPHVGRLFPVHDENRFFYTGHNIDGELLDLIRMDKGVKSVRQERQGHWHTESCAYGILSERLNCTTLFQYTCAI
ncbi:hypothetical protein EJ08DRAFT_306929 [Tothia fuscella]|uniref:Uncharacterized protein n=1 Tax=Tothia fuscella TaxID=1048955 RepID=A0A9P4NPU4_9PEZI|nr:hypothetical protein EJ08DRAFT_306929 [Tothia fuscella]